MVKKANRSILMGISSGEKIPVPEWEIIQLPDGRRARITKVSPLNALIKTQIISKHGFIAVNIGKAEVEKIIINERILSVADNYEQAIPVSVAHRRCPFCQKPICCCIVWASSERMDEKKELLRNKIFLYGSLCRTYKLEFVSMRTIRCLPEKGERVVKICWICKSDEIERIEYLPDFLKRNHPFFQSPIVDLNYLYKCNNCFSLLETKHKFVYLSAESEFSEKRLLKKCGGLMAKGEIV